MTDETKKKFKVGRGVRNKHQFCVYMLCYTASRKGLILVVFTATVASISMKTVE
jgi:hypothetical protein